jgi:hypothetical protein
MAGAARGSQRRQRLTQARFERSSRLAGGCYPRAYAPASHPLVQFASAPLSISLGFLHWIVRLPVSAGPCNTQRTIDPWLTASSITLRNLANSFSDR